jgi:hypothetical protein
MAAPLSAHAQIADRFVDGQPAEKLVQPMPTKAPKEPPPLFIVNDNIVGYYYVPTATNPGAGQTPKHVAFFSHFDVWTYGTNYFNVEYLKATNGRAPPFGTPAAPCDQNGPLDPPGSQRCPGYTEIYGFFRSTLGWNQLSGTKAFAIGPLTNIEFAFGADANTDNTTLGSAKRAAACHQACPRALSDEVIELEISHRKTIVPPMVAEGRSLLSAPRSLGGAREYDIALVPKAAQQSSLPNKG